MTSLHERLVSVPGSCPPGFGDSKTATTMLALHPKRAEKVDFVMYKAPSGDSAADKAICEEWMTRATFIEDDLRWLLQLPHDRFWCQVVFNSSLHQCIGSFLHHAPRPFDLDSGLPSDLKQKNDILYQLFFFVCLRMSTHKESKDNYISPEVFGDILYENFIFDIPKIMDICVLYGRSNEGLVAKMVANIFTQQRKYYDDLQAVVPTIVQVFDAVCSNCGFSSDSLSPPKRIMNKVSQHKSPLVTMPIDKLQDIISYLSDIAHTLRSFIEVFPQGSSSFSQGNFPQRLAALYEAISSGFGAAFKERQKQDVDDSLSHLLKRTVRYVKLCLLHVFHRIVFDSFLQCLLESTSEESASEYAEGYVDVLTAVLSEKRFLADLQMLFPFEVDKDILKQSAYKIDHTRFQYIEDAISEAVMAYGIKPTKDVAKQTTEHILKPDHMLDSEANDQYQVEDNESDRYEELGACAPRKTGIELESLIYTIKDLLPDLGDGFIKLCLEEYNYDSEKVISSILDSSLPPGLQNIDRTLQRSAETTEAGSNDKAVLNGLASEAEQRSVLGDRLNIYDGDEFDVFQNNVDITRVHIGKKNKTAVGDKSEVSSMKPFYKRFEDVVEIVEEGDGDVYDDEYDDTYDSNVVGMIDDDSPDELVARRPFVTPRILERAEPRRKADRGGSEEEDSEEERKRRDHFIEDPAKLRQMREERYAAQHANHQRRGKGHHAPGPDNGPEVPRDVKGGPKGQGQNAEVLRNRAYKERHKDSRVHHNRRDLADRKRKV